MLPQLNILLVLYSFFPYLRNKREDIALKEMHSYISIC